MENTEIQADSRRLQAQSLAQKYSNRWFLRGDLVDSKGDAITVVDPARNITIGETPNCTKAEIDIAVSAGLEAFKPWAHSDAKQRAACLRRAAEKIRQHCNEIATLLSLESGKALVTECAGEVNLISDIFEYFGDLHSEISGRAIPLRGANVAFTQHKPLGIVAGIVPWNMPLMFFGYKMAGSLLVGNCAIIKAPELAPFSILRIADLISECFPKGVFSVIVGYGNDTGQQLIQPRIYPRFLLPVRLKRAAMCTKRRRRV